MRRSVNYLLRPLESSRKALRLKLEVGMAQLPYLSTKETRRWVISEAVRRFRLRYSNQFCTTVLFSYPRSGNHAVRAVIEAVTNRPTLGAGDSETYFFSRHLIDRPIFLRVTTAPPPRLLEPAAIKRHEFNLEEGWERLIIVVRNPIDAIVSHTREMTDGQYERRVEQEVRSWLEPVYRWYSWNPDLRLLIRYADLIANPTRVLKQIEDFFGVRSDKDVVVASTMKNGMESLVRPSSSHLNSPTSLFPSRALLAENCLRVIAPSIDWKELGLDPV